ncbi:TetR/AcrR family transcriptional regulator [Microbacterium suwonense]|uniref:TetR family transcriptional regulator n=1 Tax=Microbacterium suwonense TaxID=683047 RepID=A0ABN6X2K5_9MICO|nr:TetR/AcrR family transcriptional regulator [Microbacterium suwonense]BDZ39025.1 TetR family transcriptional regulator [Microbacterium suwonense]
MDDATDLLWTPPAPSKRGPKPRFTLDAIAETAIALADEHGLEAVTMQRVASHLGTTKMALYRYLPGRTELDAVMLDRALGVPGPLPGDDWRPALAQWADGLHRRVLSKPWTVELSQRPHLPGPSELAWFEKALAAMSGLPLRGGEKLDVLTLLVGHVMSLARREGQDAASEAELARGLAPILRTHAQEFPHTAAAFAESAEEGAQDSALRFGIDRILDGVQLLLAERHSPGA